MEMHLPRRPASEQQGERPFFALLLAPRIPPSTIDARLRILMHRVQASDRQCELLLLAAALLNVHSPPARGDASRPSISDWQ